MIPMEDTQISYQIETHFSEKQMEYYRQTKPWKTGFRCLTYLCYGIGGAAMAVNMIIFITARSGEISIFHILSFLMGTFILVDGAMGNRWIDKFCEKQFQKKQLDGMALVTFLEDEIVIEYEKYQRKETFSYRDLQCAEGDFEGYYIKFPHHLLYLKRKQFKIGDRWEFPTYLNQKTDLHVIAK